MAKSRVATWSCPDCRTSDVHLQYPSGKIDRCIDCQKYYNPTVNSKAKRKRVKTPMLEISRQDFIDWVRKSDRRCQYCGLHEQNVPKIGMKTQIGLDLQALGVDRIDSSRGYSQGNIVLCCFACNKAKGNVFTSSEMQTIGKAIGQVWSNRLAAMANAPTAGSSSH